MGSIKAMQRAADKLNKSNIGYNQATNKRETFFKNGTIQKGKEADCSSLCAAIIKRGGYSFNFHGTTTQNFVSRAKAAGFKVIKFKNLSDIKAGDFLIRVVPNHGHVVFVYNKNKFFSAHYNEHGGALNGHPGNQITRGMKEVDFTNARNESYMYILRPPQD